MSAALKAFEDRARKLNIAPSREDLIAKAIEAQRGLYVGAPVGAGLISSCSVPFLPFYPPLDRSR